MQATIQTVTFGRQLPELRTPVPGPRSRELAARLARVESRNVTMVSAAGPIFWTAAAGANVRDADGNVFVDLTAGFGVAAAGHAHPHVTGAIARQAGSLVHAMGDVHPAEVKVALLERLASLAPGDLGVAILSGGGSEAVESALKTAAFATGRPGIVAFEGGYHGLGYGALAATHDPRFRAPFLRQLYGGVRFAPYPGRAGATAAAALEAVEAHVRAAARGPDAVGAVLVEPILGRGGIVVPPDDFLPRLRALCDDHGVLLVLDEVYTGFGRTGRWFACEHVDVVPDLLVVGKALAGGLPLSAAIGTRAVMDAWPPSEGEALHTSTFLGNPVACAAALAHLDALERDDLPGRAARLGARVAATVDRWAAELPGIAPARGRGLMQAIPLAGPDAAADAARVMAAAAREGVLVLPEGDALAITPPLTITEAQLDHALGVIHGLLARR